MALILMMPMTTMTWPTMLEPATPATAADEEEDEDVLIDFQTDFIQNLWDVTRELEDTIVSFGDCHTTQVLGSLTEDFLSEIAEGVYLDCKKDTGKLQEKYIEFINDELEVLTLALASHVKKLSSAYDGHTPPTPG